MGNKINEHCVSMQGSGAKLWFLRNQGLAVMLAPALPCHRHQQRIAYKY